MPPGSPFSRYIGSETAFDEDSIKWVLARLPEIPSDYPGNEYIEAQEGDTLEFIAHRKYGEWRFWDILADVNDIIDPTQALVAGQLIIAPPRQAILGEIMGKRFSGNT